VELVEITRLTWENTAISASWVRKLLAQSDITTIRQLVPPATCHYLEQLLAMRAGKSAERAMATANQTGEQ